MAPLLIILLEKLLERNVSEGQEGDQSATNALVAADQNGDAYTIDGDPEKGGGRVLPGSKKTSGTNSEVSSAADAKAYQINQFTAEREVGGDGRNANCGPTSLTMALHSLGLCVKGETSETSTGRQVDLARLSMVSDSGRDGVNGSGQRSEAEHSTYTNFTDLTRGASAAGATPVRIQPTQEAISSALQKGAKVVISGTFSGKSPLPWTGDRGSDNSYAPGGATAHIVAVTGYNSETGKFVVNDPARLTPIEVDGQTLEYFMSGNAGALSISK